MSKKLVIIGGVGVLVIGLLVFLLGFFNFSKDSKSDSADLSIIPTINQKKPENTQTFYEMEIPVPENWRYETETFNGGGIITLFPKSNPEGSRVPSFRITRWGSERLQDLSAKQNQFRNSGLEVRARTFNSERVFEFYGVDPVLANDSGREVRVRQNIIVYEFEDSVYLIQYKYNSDEDVLSNEMIFNSLLESIQFN